MRFLVLFALFFTPLACQTSQNYPALTQGNDTLVPPDQDNLNLMKYLRGKWKVSGTWQITEGQGKVKYTSRARLVGTETYQLVLNGHFLERNLDAKVSYYSRDFDKKLTNNFSALTLYSFNHTNERFAFWSFDSSGAHANAVGYFDADEKEYTFTTSVLNADGEKIEMLHKITVVSDTEYNWEVKKKGPEDYEFETVASGTSKKA